MHNRLILAAALALVVALAVVGAGVWAQGMTIDPVPYEPRLCTDPELDLNGDGVLNKADITYWDEGTRQCLDNEGHEIPGQKCDPKFDIDKDGDVDYDDLALLYRYLVTCMFPPYDVLPGPPGHTDPKPTSVRP